MRLVWYDALLNWLPPRLVPQHRNDLVVVASGKVHLLPLPRSVANYTTCPCSCLWQNTQSCLCVHEWQGTQPALASVCGKVHSLPLSLSVTRYIRYP